MVKLVGSVVQNSPVKHGPWVPESKALDSLPIVEMPADEFWLPADVLSSAIEMPVSNYPEKN